MFVCKSFAMVSMLVLLSEAIMPQMSHRLTSRHKLKENTHSLYSQKTKLIYQEDFLHKTKPSTQKPRQDDNGNFIYSKSKRSTSKIKRSKKLRNIQDFHREKRKAATLHRSKALFYITQKRDPFQSDKKTRLKQSFNSVMSYLSEKKSRREKRAIFIPDTRRIVNTTTMSQTFPFSATVKISTGCSGTLISKHHILTAAHCIHNGTAYITTERTLRVGFLKRNGKYRWYRVNTYHIPQEWFSNHGARYDYAVVRLRKPSRRKYFKLGVSHARAIAIHFASFPGDKRINTMWYSACKAKVAGDTILSRCDAAKGSSGAGLYINNHQGERIVVGVLSGAVTIRLKKGKKLHFNVGFRVTQRSARRICTWAGLNTCLV